MSDKDSYRTNKETEMNTETDGALTTIPATLSPAARDALTTALASAKSPATRRAYRTAWKAFEDFAANHGATLLPAAPEAVAAYLASRKATAGACRRSEWLAPLSPPRTILPATPTPALTAL